MSGRTMRTEELNYSEDGGDKINVDNVKSNIYNGNT